MRVRRPPGVPPDPALGVLNDAAGEFVARVPLYGPGEELQLVGVDFGQGPVRPDTMPRFAYTVLPLDDPSTICDPL